LSVYTTVGRDQLSAWLQALAVGPLEDFAGIAAGIQNSNYFVNAGGRRWVLTLFEHLAPHELAFYLALQGHLAARGIPCPRPLETARGELWRPLAGKPAALFTCLPGAASAMPDIGQCRAVGEMLARLHAAGADYPAPLPNPCGADWRERVGRSLAPHLAGGERDLLLAELDFQAVQNYSGLPRGIIHADLFHDNVLWQPDGELSGILDFYFAGEDCLLFDLAVVANDWCDDAERLRALLAGYAAQRPLTAQEAAAWPAMRRAAALRFWLLRLEVRQQPRSGAVVTIKDPDHFCRLLQRLRLAPGGLPR